MSKLLVVGLCCFFSYNGGSEWKQAVAAGEGASSMFELLLIGGHSAG